MSRAAPTFKSVFDSLTLRLGQTVATMAASADLTAKLLDCINRAYRRGYNVWFWEDAWQGVEVEPTDERLITHAALKDARRFEIWSADPREPANRAVMLRHQTSQSGALLLADAATAYVLYFPAPPQFTTTAWASGTTYAPAARVLHTDGICYKSLQGSNTNHSPDSSPTWWEAMPLLAVLEDFTSAYARGTWQIEHAAQPQTGAAGRSDALNELESLAMSESARQSTAAWRPS